MKQEINIVNGTIDFSGLQVEYWKSSRGCDLWSISTTQAQARQFLCHSENGINTRTSTRIKKYSFLVLALMLEFKLQQCENEISHRHNTSTGSRLPLNSSECSDDFACVCVQFLFHSGHPHRLRACLLFFGLMKIYHFGYLGMQNRWGMPPKCCKFNLIENCYTCWQCHKKWKLQWATCPECLPYYSKSFSVYFCFASPKWG